MPLDLRGFMAEPNQWAGLYHAADQLEKRKLRQEQLEAQKQTRRAGAATFLQNYLDPKDMLTGTSYDPMLLQGLEAAKQQGAKLVMAGADGATLMTALGPMMNKLTTYSANAKNINKRIDEQIKGMKDSGMSGYNYAALREEALKKAFYKADEKGQLQMDPDNFDPSVDYVAKAIMDNPLAVTTDDVFDQFAKKAEKFETLGDITTYTPTGTKYKSKAQLIAADYMVPEVDDQGVTVGFVPKHDIAKNQGNPLYHTFNQGGKEVRAPVRLLDEQFFDKGLWPAMQHRLRGMAQEHINQYSKKTGQKVDIDSPEAKDLARAFGYDMFNVPSRKGGAIRHIETKGQPSTAMVNLRVQQSSDYLQNEFDKAAARKGGRVSVQDPNDPDQYKRNTGEAIGDIFTGKEDISGNEAMNLNGDVFTPDGKAKSVKDYKVIDVTSSMPGGSLKAGGGADYKYKRIFYNPDGRALIAEQESGPEGKKSTKYMEIPESNIGAFIYRIAEANGIPRASVKSLLEKLGYSGGKFNQPRQSAADTPAGANPYAEDLNQRKQKSWHDAAQSSIKSPFGKSF